ncbi:hypothetical protein E4K73_47075 [Streptomyces sp. IB201691-2A2]|nr:hypothetical protein E4K73_47075 [Streptomyces sp. IB201691-2A2]
MEELKAERARKEEKARAPRQAQQTTDESAEGTKGSQPSDYDVITSPPAHDALATASTEGSPTSDYDVITGPAVNGAPAADTAEATTSETIPEPRVHSPASGTAKAAAEAKEAARKVPYDQPGALAMLLDAKVGSDDLFFDLLRFLSMKGLERNSARLGELARSFAEQASVQAD